MMKTRVRRTKPAPKRAKARRRTPVKPTKAEQKTMVAKAEQRAVTGILPDLNNIKQWQVAMLGAMRELRPVLKDIATLMAELRAAIADVVHHMDYVREQRHALQHLEAARSTWSEQIVRQVIAELEARLQPKN